MGIDIGRGDVDAINVEDDCEVEFLGVTSGVMSRGGECTSTMLSDVFDVLVD